MYGRPLTGCSGYHLASMHSTLLIVTEEEKEKDREEMEKKIWLYKHRGEEEKKMTQEMREHLIVAEEKMLAMESEHHALVKRVEVSRCLLEDREREYQAELKLLTTHNEQQMR